MQILESHPDTPVALSVTGQGHRGQMLVISKHYKWKLVSSLIKVCLRVDLTVFKLDSPATQAELLETTRYVSTALFFTVSLSITQDYV